jgi:hypothetical protein
MRIPAQWIIGAILLVPLAACGGGDDPAGPGGGGAGMSARVDGQSWTATFAHGVRDQASVVVGAAGQGAGTQINFALVSKGTGTYPLGPAGDAAYLTQGGNGWVTGASGGSGSVTLTTLTDTRIAGTFEFTAVPVTGGASGTRTITQGSFDVEFTNPIGAL